MAIDRANLHVVDLLDELSHVVTLIELAHLGQVGLVGMGIRYGFVGVWIVQP
jgi:hypothetical protein